MPGIATENGADGHFGPCSSEGAGSIAGGGGSASLGADCNAGGGGGGFLSAGQNGLAGGGAGFPNLAGGMGDSAANQSALAGGNGGYGGGGGGSSNGSGGGGGGYSGGGAGFGAGGGGSFDAAFVNSDVVRLSGINSGDGFVTIQPTSLPAGDTPERGRRGLMFAGLLMLLRKWKRGRPGGLPPIG